MSQRKLIAIQRFTEHQKFNTCLDELPKYTACLKQLKTLGVRVKLSNCIDWNDHHTRITGQGKVIQQIKFAPHKKNELIKLAFNNCPLDPASVIYDIFRLQYERHQILGKDFIW